MQDTSDTGVVFYSALAQEAGGAVLEIACGTGRVTIPLAALGFTTYHFSLPQADNTGVARTRQAQAALPVRSDKRTHAARDTRVTPNSVGPAGA